METATNNEPNESIFKPIIDEFEIFDDFDCHIGKLKILDDKNRAVFEDYDKKYIFEKIGFWKNNIEIRFSNKQEILYSLSCNGHNNSSEIKLNNGIEILLKHGEFFGNYWEWQQKITQEPLFGYSVVHDFENVISVKRLIKNIQNSELNLICALGYFILLKF